MERLFSETVQKEYTAAIDALCSRLDPGSKTMAAQDFRHSLQKSSESVSDFIRQLEKTFQIAYGKDHLNHVTRDTLLYGQLYEGLTYNLMRSPAVSHAQSYPELCTAAKGKERQLAALKQRRHLTHPPATTQPSTTQPHTRSSEPKSHQRGMQPSSKGRVCFKYNNPGYFSKNCPQGERE